MFVENVELFHFNNNVRRNDIWQVGNEIDNTENYFSDYYNGALHFAANVPTTKNEMCHFSEIIDDYLTKEQDTETYIKMLETASVFLKHYSTVQREMVLEQVRKELYPYIPSRKNCIWLCDERQLEFWKEKLGNRGDLFKVSITGELFKTSDIFLPDKEMNIIESYEQAKKYWNPDFSNIDESKTEYLFQGKLKILKKLDKIN